MYDRDVFLPNEEYKQKYHNSLDIKSIIEKPQVYLLACCPSNDQQILYIEEGLQDIRNPNLTITSSKHVPIKDELCIFKGDKRAAQFEAGQQKGGNFFLLYHTSKLPYMSLQNRIDHFLVSQASKEISNSRQLKLFDNLTKDAIVQELHERNVKFTCTSSAKDLNALLENEVHGVQRVPALMYNNPLDTLASLNLLKYEILLTEPLHDISNQTKNLYQEIPYHVPKNKTKNVRQILDVSFNGRVAKSSSDYRKSLLIVAKWFSDNLPEHFFNKILLSMCNIQAITYYSEKKRSLQSVLRLYSTTFQHALTIKTSLLGNIKGSTACKFFTTQLSNILRFNTGYCQDAHLIRKRKNQHSIA